MTHPKHPIAEFLSLTVLLSILGATQASAVTIFADDFESGAPGWTAGRYNPDPGTDWELGSPTVGPPGAHSGVTVFGTNLSSDYGFDADIWLRSPVIDLTGLPDAMLHYFSFLDIEQGFDGGRVSIIGAEDEIVLSSLAIGIDSSTNGWESVSLPLPPEALGERVRVEFRFLSDDFASFDGWYLDDVSMSASIPEPSSIALLWTGLALLWIRRRR